MDKPLPFKLEISERLRDEFLTTLKNIKQQIFRYCKSEDEKVRVTLTVFLALASEMVARSLMTIEDDGIAHLLDCFNEEVMTQINDIKRIISENNLGRYTHPQESS